jgi:small-conductance mechanosensitive channel
VVTCCHTDVVSPLLLVVVGLVGLVCTAAQSYNQITRTVAATFTLVVVVSVAVLGLRLHPQRWHVFSSSCSVLRGSPQTARASGAMRSNVAAIKCLDKGVYCGMRT